MNKKPVRKIQLARETLRILSKEQLSNVEGGGTTSDPTATLTDGTGPFPSRAACTLNV
ncbi:MAG TPA: class I lanthipeptide [Kofleriaceae bacterium]